MESSLGALVGRAAEVAFARDLLSDPETTSVVIGGPAGVGKSRLVAEICRELMSTWLIRRAVATVTARTFPLAALASLMPPGWDHFESSFLPPNREQLLRRMRGALVAGEDERRVLLVVDDAHLLDETSATLLHQVALTGDADLLLVVRTNKPCPPGVDALMEDSGCARLELQPLSRDETAELAGALTGAWLEESSISRLFEVTGGSPLYLREVLDESKRSGSLVEERGLLRWTGDVDTPRLTELVAMELGQRSDAEREFLDQLAVGEPLPFTVALELTERSVLCALEGAGVISVDEQQVVTFGHPLFGESRRAQLKPLRQGLIEQALADAFDAVEIADPDQRIRALCWGLPRTNHGAAELVEAAQRLFNRGDLARAEQLADVARMLEPGQPEAELLLAEIFELTGRPEVVLTLLEGSTERMPSDQMRSRAICCRIRVLVDVLNRVEQAELVAAEIAEVTDPIWRSYLEAHWASTRAMLGRPEEVAAIGDRLFAHPDERVRLRAVGTVNLAALARGEIEAGLAATTSMVGPALRLRDEIAQAPSWVFTALMVDLFALGRLDELEGVLGLVSSAPSSQVPIERAFELLIRGKLALFRGRPVTARRFLTECIGLYAENDPRGLGVSACGSLALCCAQLRDVQGAEAAVAHVARHPLGRASRLMSHDIRRELAWAPLARGDAGRAVRELVEVADESTDAGLPVFAGFALHDAVRLGAGNSLRERLIAVASEVDGELADGWRRHAAGLLADDGTALEDAAEHFDRLGYTLVGVELHAAAHHSFLRAGRLAAASREAALVRDRRELCEGAVAGPISLEVGADRLTARELQIARLAAAGSSSRDVAESLGVSVRTVDNQLGRIYAKLGVTGRTGVEAALGEASITN